jgi:hypothetical protein
VNVGDGHVRSGIPEHDHSSSAPTGERGLVRAQELRHTHRFRGQRRILRERELKEARDIVRPHSQLLVRVVHLLHAGHSDVIRLSERKVHVPPSPTQ